MLSGGIVSNPEDNVYEQAAQNYGSDKGGYMP